MSRLSSWAWRESRSRLAARDLGLQRDDLVEVGGLAQQRPQLVQTGLHRRDPGLRVDVGRGHVTGRGRPLHGRAELAEVVEDPVQGVGRARTATSSTGCPACRRRRCSPAPRAVLGHDHPAGGERDLTRFGGLGLDVVDLYLQRGGPDQLVGGRDVGGRGRVAFRAAVPVPGSRPPPPGPRTRRASARRLRRPAPPSGPSPTRGWPERRRSRPASPATRPEPDAEQAPRARTAMRPAPTAASGSVVAGKGHGIPPGWQCVITLQDTRATRDRSITVRLRQWRHAHPPSSPSSAAASRTGRGVGAVAGTTVFESSSSTPRMWSAAAAPAREVAGYAVDVGAESMLARRPEATEPGRASSVSAVGLTHPEPVPAAVWSRGRRGRYRAGR